MRPIPTNLFHITAVDNLENVLRSGFLKSKNKMTEDGESYSSIAYSHIQERRQNVVVPLDPGGSLHDYVPFYFAPRSPMLYTINNGNVPGCNHTQETIIHFQTTAERIEEVGLPYVFFDLHAAVFNAQCYNNFTDLEKIVWRIFFDTPLIGGYSKWWHSRIDVARYVNRQEIRQAEFLVFEKISVNLIEVIGVQNNNTENIVRTLLLSYNVDIPVQVKPEWYY